MLVPLKALCSTIGIGAVVFFKITFGVSFAVAYVMGRE